MSECKYCRKESYDRPFCPECAKKYFNMTLYIPEQKNIEHEIDNKTNSNENNKEIELSSSNTLVLDKFEYYDPIKLYNKINSYKQDFSKHDNKKTHICADGCFVRSKGEEIIYNWLLKNNIPFEYEKEIKYKVDIVTDYFKLEKEKTIHPDFFIPGPITINNQHIENLYIEYWGIEEKKKYKNFEEYQLVTNYIKTKEYKLKVYKNLNCTLLNLYQEDIIDFENNFFNKIRSINIQEIKN